MPQLRLHLEWDDEYDNRDIAKADLQQIWEEIEQLSEQAITLEVFDVVPHPAKAGVIAPQQDERVTLVPPFEQVHPWDEGINIFPDDHPLSPVEQMLKRTATTDNSREAAQKELLEAQRALPLPEPLEPDDTP